jgi:hypothetical protein
MPAPARVVPEDASKFKKRQKGARAPRPPAATRLHPALKQTQEGARAARDNPATSRVPSERHTTQGTRHTVPGHDGDRLRAGL